VKGSVGVGGSGNQGSWKDLYEWTQRSGQCRIETISLLSIFPSETKTIKLVGVCGCVCVCVCVCVVWGGSVCVCLCVCL
jgi:hypothetical protein